MSFRRILKQHATKARYNQMHCELKEAGRYRWLRCAGSVQQEGRTRGR